MAESAVNLLIEVLRPIIANEVRLLGDVHDEVKDIMDEMESMVSCLREADQRENDNDGVKTWVKQLREAAYDTEDVVEEYLLHLKRRLEGRGRLLKFLHRNFQCALHLGTRHRIATQVQEIKLRVQNIAARRERYNFGEADHHDSSNRYNGPRMASLHIDEAEVVGIDEPKEKLFGWLTNDERGRVVISVVAMGGMGKTTLVKKVYDHAMVRESFNCFHFVVVSKTYSVIEIIRDLIKKMHEQTKRDPPPGLDRMNKFHELVPLLNAYLQDKRYVIVFDDVWDSEFWEDIQFAFPVNSYGRIIITTREVSVAQSCTLKSGHLYECKPLKDDEAWDLFCRTTFPSSQCCPDELEELSRNFVKFCQGLPLAIVAIGGMLAVKDKTMNEWERIRRGGFGMYDEREHTIVNMKRIILQSYNDLPYNLKSCFLYLSLFPENYNIKFMKLIRLWMAEGFVKSNQQNIMVEEVAKEYINVLIKRGLILVADRNRYGKVISCRVHDVVREIILLKARENFTTFVSTDGVQMPNRPRRLSVHESFDATSQDRGFTGFTNVRSLFMFGKTELSTSSHEFFSSFRLLKVLDLDGMLIEVFPPEITELLHLKYLSLRDTSISEFPKSIKRLRSIETLDLKGTMVRELPVEILELRKLRHLLVYLYDHSSDFDIVKGVRMPMGIGKMRELQKLCFIDVGGRDSKSGQVKELRKLTQLKRLGIIKLRTEDGRDLCDAIQNMESLLAFDVTSSHENELLDLCLSQPPKLLQRVYLKGMLESLPIWITMLQNLVRLHLKWSKLKDDPFESLQNLPNLAELELFRAYDGNELRCGEGGFKKLKVLDILNLDELKVVEIGKGAMCGLQKLRIWECLQLEKVPLGIEYIANLKELDLWVGMSEELYSRVRKDGGEDRPRIEHIQNFYAHPNI